MYNISAQFNYKIPIHVTVENNYICNTNVPTNQANFIHTLHNLCAQICTYHMRNFCIDVQPNMIFKNNIQTTILAPNLQI